MADKISVLLLEDVASLGKAGEIVTVAEGYARNQLFPAGQAALATDQVRREAKAKEAKHLAAHQADLAALQARAQLLDGTELTLTARVKEGEEIFGKITAAQIAKELNHSANLQLKPKDITLEEPITTIGTHGVLVHLSPDVEATIQVQITPDPNQPSPHADEKD